MGLLNRPLRKRRRDQEENLKALAMRYVAEEYDADEDDKEADILKATETKVLQRYEAENPDVRGPVREAFRQILLALLPYLVKMFTNKLGLPPV